VNATTKTKLTTLLASMNDTDLQEASRMVAAAYRNNSRVAASGFSPGDRVRITTDYPKYLNGLEGHVVKLNQSTVRIRIVPEHVDLARRFAPVCDIYGMSLTKVDDTPRCDLCKHPATVTYDAADWRDDVDITVNLCTRHDTDAAFNRVCDNAA
jgi:hypothetical protein